LFLLHDNAATHWLGLVKDFLSKNNMTTLEHPPYSPGLSTPDFYLFSRLKSVPKGQCFCYTTEIIKNATDELKRFS
jgi:histone-lysine N-methyltransferase SETMAR